MESLKKSNHSKISFAGVLITIGIVFGDLGTSPLYVFQAITKGTNFSPDLILGSLSAVIWSLILIIGVKYIFFALNADNNGEGGIFSLFALLKQRKIKWIVIPALIGSASLIADGFMTPAISISSAIEGLSIINPDLPTIPIVVAIIILLFSLQQFGTDVLGKGFGPIMIVWFGTLLYLGIINIQKNPIVFQAFNPYWIYNLIAHVDNGIWVFGAISLCITGAESLYSDLGHCGKGNIRVSWSLIFAILLINYMGQAALCLTDGFSLKPNETIFFASIPDHLLTYVIGLATLASVIASQALITGIFTLINEAIKLRLWTNLRIKYPTDHHGQIYIPAVNWFLMCGCLLVIVIFRKSHAMEASYGLAITINMVMTSILLGILMMYRFPKVKYFFTAVFVFFIIIEGFFVLANVGKIIDGGWFSLLFSSLFFSLLFLFYKARKLRSSIMEYVPMSDVVNLLEAVRNDQGINYESTNLVYPVRSQSAQELDYTVFYSLFRKKPRKADIVWFVHIDIKPEPWGVNFSLEPVIDKHCYYLTLQLGFKEEHRIDYMLKRIHDKLVEKGKITGKSIFDSVYGVFNHTDFKYVVINSRVSTDHLLSTFESISVKVYRFIKHTGLQAAEDFGLDKTNVEEEFVPISIGMKYDREIVPADEKDL